MRALNWFKMKRALSFGIDTREIGSRGFTLLELMIAISIFGLLMLSISQLMRQEIRLYGAATYQNEVQQKARTAMVHILDEIRLQPFTFYSSGPDSGVYYYDTAQQGKITCLIDVNPTNLSQLPIGTKLYYDAPNRSLWYRDNPNNTTYLVSDEIYSLSITPVNTDVHFVKINLVAGDPSTPQTFELLTWVRLY